MFLFYVLSFFKKGDTIQGGDINQGIVKCRSFNARTTLFTMHIRFHLLRIYMINKPTFISRTNECGSHKDATDVGFKNNWDHTDQLFLLNMLKMAKHSREERKKPTQKYLETIL